MLILENTPRNGLSPPTGPELKMDLDERIIANALTNTDYHPKVCFSSASNFRTVPDFSRFSI